MESDEVDQSRPPPPDRYWLAPSRSWMWNRSSGPYRQRLRAAVAAGSSVASSSSSSSSSAASAVRPSSSGFSTRHVADVGDLKRQATPLARSLALSSPVPSSAPPSMLSSMPSAWALSRAPTLVLPPSPVLPPLPHVYETSDAASLAALALHVPPTPYTPSLGFAAITTPSLLSESKQEHKQEHKHEHEREREPEHDQEEAAEHQAIMDDPTPLTNLTPDGSWPLSALCSLLSALCSLLSSCFLLPASCFLRSVRLQCSFSEGCIVVGALACRACDFGGRFLLSIVVGISGGIFSVDLIVIVIIVTVAYE